MQLTKWTQELIQSLKLQKTQKVLELLQPFVDIKGKEQFSGDKIPDDMFYHFRSNFQEEADQQAISKFVTGFLTHSKLLDLNKAGKIVGKQAVTIKNEIFGSMILAFSGFETLCDQPYMDGRWIGSLIDHLCKLLSQYSIEADKELNESAEARDSVKSEHNLKSAHAQQNKALSVMESLFRRILPCNNQPPDNRRFGDFYIALRMIKLQFKQNSYKISQTYFKWIDTQVNQNVGYSLDQLTDKYRVTLAFYQGRFQLYKNELSLARQELRYAFQNCPNDYLKSKKKILRFLVPVEMNLNKFPTKTLLTKYQLNEYIPLSEACIDGDLKKFDETLEQYMDQYVMSGVYLAVEKLRHLTIRNLIKKYSLVIKNEPTLQPGFETQPHVLKLENIFSIMSQWDQELDLDELECIIANQIYLGFIRGHIMHDRRLLVLAKNMDPFSLKYE